MAKSSNSSGKLVDTWYYEYDGLAEEEREYGSTKQFVEPKKVPVEVRICKQYQGEVPPLSVKEVYFLLVCDEAGFTVQGPDIEALRAEMFGRLDKRFAVKWESYFLVEIDRHSPYIGIGSGFTLGYESVEKGTAFGGTLLLRQHKYGRGEVIKPWPGAFKKKNDSVIACIEATKANRQALADFSGRIDTLRELLSGLIKPEKIMDTLMGMANMPLLPSPDVDAAELRREGKA